MGSVSDISIDSDVFHMSDGTPVECDENYSSLRVTSQIAAMSWHDVSFTHGTKVVLNNVTGSVFPSGLTALIGPNESGKSTLIQCLASQFSWEARVKGEVRICDRAFAIQRSNNFRSVISLIDEKSLAFLPFDSSPREIISFHVKLRLPHANQITRTSQIIDLMGLSECADEPVSSISQSQRVQLLVGIETVRTPSILLIDQPLAALDVSESQQMMNLLRSLCRNTGVSIMFTSSRLSSELFFSMDRVIILSRGFAVYQGEPGGLSSAFADCGHPCPDQHSPADFCILLLQSANWQEHKYIVDHWHWTFGNKIDSLIESPRRKKGVNFLEGFKSKRPPRWDQFSAIISRDYLALWRSPGMIITKLSTTFFLSVLVGALYYNLGDGDTTATPLSMEEYTGAIGFIILTSLFGEVEVIAATIPLTLKRFLVEYSSGLYSSQIFFIAQICIELVQTFIGNLCQLLIIYFMVGLKGDFFYWLFCLNAVSIAHNSFGWLISCTTRTAMSAMQLLPLVFLPQIFFAGVIINISLIPKSVAWLQYFCYLKYTFNLVFITEFWGQITNPVVVDYAETNQIELESGEIISATKDGLFRALPSTLLLSFVLVPAVSKKIFSSFDCVSYDFDTAAGESREFLRDDPSIGDALPWICG